MTGSWSLRQRVRRQATIVGVLVLSASAFAMYVGIARARAHDFDAFMLVRAEVLRMLVREDPRRVEVDFDVAQHPEFSRELNPDYWDCRTSDGHFIFRSPSLLSGGGTLNFPTFDFNPPYYSDTVLPDGRLGRQVSISGTSQRMHGSEDRVKPITSSPVVITLAVERASLDLDLQRVALILGGICVIAMFAIAVVMDLVARKLVTPIARLAGRIASLDAEQLRLQSSDLGTPRELSPVIDRLDELLDRLARALDRERSFSADLAHELRTPLAGLRTSMEVVLRKPRAPEDYRSCLESCREICMQTQGMIETILEVARAEGGRNPAQRECVDLSQSLTESWHQVRAEAEARGLRCFWKLTPEQAIIDPDHLRIILANLFSNAVTYANTGGDIEVSLQRGPGARIDLSIGNTGCRLSPDQAEQVFARFWRGDSSRSATGIHCGLGLSLCRTLADLNQATIVASIVDGRFIVTISFEPAKPS